MGRVNFFVRVKESIWRLWRYFTCDSPYYRSSRFVADLATASQVREREIAFVAEASHLKWAVLICPCGCGDRISANLMKTQRPYWTVKFENDVSVSIRPSCWLTADPRCSH